MSVATCVSTDAVDSSEQMDVTRSTATCSASSVQMAPTLKLSSDTIFRRDFASQNAEEGAVKDEIRSQEWMDRRVDG